MDASDGIVLEPRHYEILTAASVAEVRTNVLKSEDTFAVFDPHGDIVPIGNREQGLYHEGTRFLSRMEVWMQSKRPVLLGSAVRDDNTVLTVDLTNPDFKDENDTTVLHGTLHIFRSKLLWNDRCFERLYVRNFGDRPIRFSLSFILQADYADIFEVRGLHRSRRGVDLPSEAAAGQVLLRYRGLDQVERRTRIDFDPVPDVATADEVRYDVDAAPGARKRFGITVACITNTSNAADIRYTYGSAHDEVHRKANALKESSCRIRTTNEQFNAWSNRSLDDLNLLLTNVSHGYYPYAGIPWYNTYFGRDALLTALMTLWVNPAIARGVLGYLAETQARSHDAPRAAQPGKILHEARTGEMATLREIPFQRYYGTVDATPLFVYLAGKYLAHTGDVDFIKGIWDNIQAAVRWIDDFGDVDGDGFVEYEPDPEGLTNQGWKDSEDSVFHADGTLAPGAIALCEVQSYVYGAKREAAAMATEMGDAGEADRLLDDARVLKDRFESTFWCEDISSYALALDGDGRTCSVRTSNAGHALFTGIASEASAARMAESLFRRDLFSGWGIRTLSSKERRFNPLSYHNGSVWPHDNAVIGAGLARYGYRREAGRLLHAFADAALFDPQQRLPELFCGFSRRKGEGPTPYPVACSPQAWAAVTIFHLLRACIGMRVDARTRQVVFNEPYLPPSLEEVGIENLKVGDARIDLVLQRYDRSVGVNVTAREGAVEVTTTK